MYDISTDTQDASANWWTFPAAEEAAPDEQPRVYYDTPTGREYRTYRRLEARYSDARREFIDGELDQLAARHPEGDTAEELSPEEALALMGAAAQAEDDEELDDIDDDKLEVVASVRMQRFEVPDELLAGYLDFVRPHVTRLENIGRGGRELRWEDDGQLVEVFGDLMVTEDRPTDQLAEKARNHILLSLGRPPRREQNLRALAGSVAEGLSEDQKKD